SRHPSYRCSQAFVFAHYSGEDFMYKRILILFVFITHPLGEAKRDRLVFWNVGQGSWATALRTYDCLHFDMGGEFAPPRLLLEPCLNVKNRLYLSHMDWDH